MQSRITELDPPRKLAITWGSSGGVSFELEPKGNEVLLTVIHRRLPDRETLLKVSAGWHMHLDILVARATGKEPAPFWEGWSRLSRNTTGACRPDGTHLQTTKQEIAMKDRQQHNGLRGQPMCRDAAFDRHAPLAEDELSSEELKRPLPSSIGAEFKDHFRISHGAAARIAELVHRQPSLFG